MPSEFEITVRLNIRSDLLWRIRGSRTFMEFLVRNGALQRMEAKSVRTIDEDKSQGTITKQRKQIYVPGDLMIPEIIKPVIDESYIEIMDEQTWKEGGPIKDTELRQESLIRPTLLGDVITTHAILEVKDDEQDNNYCLHTLKGNVSVTILFLGYFVEQAVITNMKQFYENYPNHINDFVDFTCHKFGDGSMSSLGCAIDKMLLTEPKSL